MRDGIQTFLAEAGESACYALSIIELAERAAKKTFDVAATLLDAISKGYIYYNAADSQDNDNFFVRQPDRLLESLTGRPWSIAKRGPDYKPRDGELVVERWERRKTGITIGHFRLHDWDSLVDSLTVKAGAIASLRVFTPRG